jgi:SAM-dependent methyltransferase
MHKIPTTGTPLLVPIMTSPRDPQKALGKEHTAHKTLPQLFPEWPNRMSIDTIDWRRFRNGSAFDRCRRAKNPMETHWFCTHLTDQVAVGHRRAIESMKIVFERADVRLVLDVGGSVGVFASELHKVYGDRIICTTADVYNSPGFRPHERLIQWPLHQLLGARGLPSIAVDGFSFLPIGESTLDALHTSWLYHNGFPSTALWEFFRVLRPGGYLILHAMWMTRSGAYTMRTTSGIAWNTLRRQAMSMRMREVHFVDAPTLGHGSMMILQMPISPEWADYRLSDLGPTRAGSHKSREGTNETDTSLKQEA